MVIVTEKFKTTPAMYAGVLLRRWLLNNLWWLLAPVAVFLILGLKVNNAFFYFTFIYLLCLGPFVLAVVYFHHALSPAIVSKTFNQFWEFGNSSATAHYLPITTIDDRTVAPQVDTLVIDSGKIRKVGITSGNLVLTLRNDYDIHLIPLDSINGKEELSSIIKFYETNS
ncbi:MAG: hypothetical protein K2O00_05345 [Muribaculaceae bacterium]|nr:hypothetical protein [Muribaculaceae bacterium]